MNEKKVFTIVGVFAVVVTGIFLSSGLGHNYNPSVPHTNPSHASDLIPFTTLIQSTQSKIATRINYLITSESQLAKLWQMIAATGTPPTVNFSTHEILAVFAGTPTSSAIQVSKVQDTSVRNVQVTIVVPGTGCTTTVKHMIPYELVAVPSSTLPVTHEDVVATSTCAL